MELDQVYSSGGGRPSKDWADISDRTRRRRVSGLADGTPTSILACAVAKRSKASPGMKDLGFVVKKSTVDPAKARKALEFNKEPLMMSDEEALALKIHCDLSDSQYQLIRNSSIKHNANIYPTLHRILEAKKDCYPADIQIR